jgi:hypothetical protein
MPVGKGNRTTYMAIVSPALVDLEAFTREGQIVLRANNPFYRYTWYY